jgi:hypothetical protein
LVCLQGKFKEIEHVLTWMLIVHPKSSSLTLTDLSSDQLYNVIWRFGWERQVLISFSTSYF